MTTIQPKRTRVGDQTKTTSTDVRKARVFIPYREIVREDPTDDRYILPYNGLPGEVPLGYAIFNYRGSQPEEIVHVLLDELVDQATGGGGPALQAPMLNLAGNILEYTDAHGNLATTSLASFLDDINILNTAFNPGNQEFTITETDGQTHTVALSSLLDDTNLARIISGAVDSATGIMTLTRDDATTFDVDLSMLMNAAITNTVAGNRIGTLSVGGGAGVDINETITTLVQDAAACTAEFTSEDGTTTTIQEFGVSADAGNSLVLGSDNKAFVPPTSWTHVDTNATTEAVALAPDHYYRKINNGDTVYTLSLGTLESGDQFFVENYAASNGDLQVNYTAIIDGIVINQPSITLKPGCVYGFSRQSGGAITVTSKYPDWKQEEYSAAAETIALSGNTYFRNSNAGGAAWAMSLGEIRQGEPVVFDNLGSGGDLVITGLNFLDGQTALTTYTVQPGCKVTAHRMTGGAITITSVYPDKTPNEDTSDIFKQLDQWELVNGALPVVQVDQDGCVAARIEDPAGGFSLYRLASSLPTADDQCVKVKFKKTGDATQEMFLRLAHGGGVVSDIQVNTETGAVNVNAAGAGAVPAEVLSTQTTTDTVCVIARWPQQAGTSWNIFPSVAGSNAAQTGAVDIIELDLDYPHQQQELKCFMPDEDTQVAYSALDRTNLPTVGRIVVDQNITFNHSGGSVVTRDVNFEGPSGILIPATLTVEHVSNSGAGSLVLIAATGQFNHNQGTGDYIVSVSTKCRQAHGWHMYATGTLGSEQKVFQATNPVTSYDQGAGGINLTLPYVGGWNNGNNNAFSGFGFDASKSFSVRSNGNATTGSGFRIVMAEGPDAIERTVCEVLNEQVCQIAELEGDLVLTERTTYNERQITEISDRLDELVAGQTVDYGGLKITPTISGDPVVAANAEGTLIQTTATAGTASIQLDFNKPVTVVFGAAVVSVDEAIVLNTPGYFVGEYNGGVEVGNTVHNGNSGGRFAFGWRDVTSVSFDMPSEAGASSNVSIEILCAEFDTEVSCYENSETGIQTVVASCGKDDLRILEDGTIPANLSLPPGDVKITDARFNAEDMNVFGQPGGNGLFRIETASGSAGAYASYNNATGIISGTAPSDADLVLTAYFKTIGVTGNTTRSYHFRDVLAGDAVGTVSGTSGVFGRFSGQSPASVTVPAGTAYSFDVRSVSSSANQRLAGGSYISACYYASADQVASKACAPTALSSEDGNVAILGDDGEVYAMPLIATECYEPDGSVVPGFIADPQMDTVPNAAALGTTSQWIDTGLGTAILYAVPGVGLGANTGTGPSIEGFGQVFLAPMGYEFTVIVDHRGNSDGNSMTVEIYDGTLNTDPLLTSFTTTNNGNPGTGRFESFTFRGTGSNVLLQFFNNGTGNHGVNAISTLVAPLPVEVNTYSDGEQTKHIINVAGVPTEVSLTGLQVCDEETVAKNAVFSGPGPKVAVFNGDIDVDGTIDPDGMVYDDKGRYSDVPTAAAYFTGKGYDFNKTTWVNPADDCLYLGPVKQREDVATVADGGRLGEFFFAKSGSTVPGYLAVSAGTIAGGAAANPNWAAMYPEFVSGADIVFPAGVEGMFLRNVGGNASAEATAQADGTAQNGLSGVVNNTASNDVATEVDGGAGRNVRFNSATRSVVFSSTDPETRPLNMSFQLYTIVDGYKVPAKTQSMVSFEWEENGGLANGSNQWSIGNGSTGNTGVVVPTDGRIKYMTFHAETAGTSITIEILENNTTVIGTGSFTGQTGVFTFATPIELTAGTNIRLRTGVETGAYTDARVAVFVVLDDVI